MRALHGLLIGVLLATGGARFCAAHLADQDAPIDLQQKTDQANGGDCARLNMQAARKSVEDAKRLFESGDLKSAHNAIDLSLRYVGRSVNCSLQARKREKDTEIDLRRLIERMREVLHTLDTDERPQLSRSLNELEEQRDRLLHAIFGAAAGDSASEKKP